MAPGMESQSAGTIPVTKHAAVERLFYAQKQSPSVSSAGAFLYTRSCTLLSQISKLLREIRIMSEKLSTGRFAALFLLGLLYVLSDVLEAISRVIH